jgi:hemolysin activation/secretion protein
VSRAGRRRGGPSSREARLRSAAGVLLALVAAGPAAARATEPGAPAPADAPPPAARTLDVNEYRAVGASRLTEAEVQAALDPFLGPGRTLADVERARAALEKAYADRGWHAVSVAIPRQTVREGVVNLAVTEGRVARLRVRGARWFSPRDIRLRAPSMAEGTVPNFEEVVRDIYALNQLPDRRVTPALRAGTAPGTLEVDLNVEDRLPLHGSIEVNDRASAGTTSTRLKAALRYDNLWQLGHSLAFSFQVAPERREDGQVYAASYLVRFPGAPWLGLTASATVQDSDVSTLGGIAVTGRGRIFGLRAGFTLPSPKAWFQTLGVGLEHKRFHEGISLGEKDLRSPVAYWPLTVQYAASRQGEGSQTQLGASAAFNLRAASSSPESFDTKRYGASGGFVLFRGELARADDLPLGLRVSARLQGQYSAHALVGSEQLTAGGVESVRGYREAAAAGDLGASFQLEVQSPSLGRGFLRSFVDDWRFHAFADAAWVAIHLPLPDTEREALPLGVGAGTRFTILGHGGGAVDLGLPLATIGDTRRHHPHLHLRAWSEF